MVIPPVFHVLLDRVELDLAGGTVRLCVSSDKVAFAVLKPDVGILAHQALAPVGRCLDQVLGNQSLLVSRRLDSKLGTTCRRVNIR